MDMKVTICIGSFCHVKGAPQIISELQRLVAEHDLKDKVELAGKFCMKKCENPQKVGVSVTVDGKDFDLAPDKIEEFFNTEILAKA